MGIFAGGEFAGLGINYLNTATQTKPVVLHGGDIVAASRQYNIAVDQWVDLSTGLNPQAYPVEEIPQEVFTRLPYELPDLCQAAADYYGNEDVMAVSGTQLAIQCLPQCLPQFDILAPKVGYQEHVLHWANSGVNISYYPALEMKVAVECIEQKLIQNPQRHLLIINPNNPTGLKFTPQQIKLWASRLAKGCYVIVDEAFMDMSPQHSVLADLSPNMIVLRSFGKFFGLAGLRLGFVFANQGIRQALQQKTGLWAVNGPAQHVAIKALRDKPWQQKARIDIHRSASLTIEIFTPLFERILPDSIHHEALFSSYYLPTKRGEQLVDFFAHRGILIRKIAVDEKICLLRTGIIHHQDFDSQQRVKQCIQDFIVSQISKG